MTIKLLIRWALVGGLAVMFQATATAATFPDVSENSEYYGAVEYMFEKGIIQGYQDGTFKPDQTINRVESLKVLLLANEVLSGESESAISIDTGLPFPDVPSDVWFYDFVYRAYNQSFVEGYPDGTFKPANTINIAESMKVVLLTFNAELGDLEKDPYPDVTKTDWYATYADYSRDKNLIAPLDNGRLDAGRQMTRGDFIRLIYRFLYIEEHDLENFPLNINWPYTGSSEGKFTVSYPFEWAVLEAGNQLILWKPDAGNGQISFARTYPNSATVIIAVDPNESRLDINEYLENFDYGNSAQVQSMTLNGYPFVTISMTDQGIADYYFEFPNKSILVAYTQVGDGANREYLAEQIRYLIGSIRYDENASKASESYAKEQFLSSVREKILVNGEAGNVLSMFNDLVIIETDSIGIGTGPVDYHYSEEFDVTLKVERDSDTLLALRDSNSTSF
ncbi:S-layer homology domain-containing protein [Pseudomonadota bacterium]